MTDAARDRSPSAAGDVLRTVIDLVVPPDAAAACGRVRNEAVLAAVLAWTLPATPLLGTATRADAIRVSACFAGAAAVAHVLRRRESGARAAPVAMLLAGVSGGLPPRPWALGLGVVAAALAAVSVARARRTPAVAPPVALGGLSGIAWGILSALVAREFAVLPIHVPTGSMEPAIFGASPGTPGDQVLVDRLVYATGDPQRFDVCVFEFPLHRPTTFVKRVIGLPGETVEIRDGEVRVDGRIPRKPELVQESMWREVFPRPGPRAEPLKVAEAWRTSERDGLGWAAAGDGLRCTPPKGRESVVRWSRSLPTGDVRLRFAMTAAPGAVATFRIRTRGEWTEFAIGGESPTCTVRAGGSESSVSVADGLPDEVRVVDGTASVRRAGRELVSIEAADGGGTQHAMEIVVRGGEVTLGALRADRDQTWTRPRSGPSRWDVPDGSWFVLGDNSERSEDSREWRVTEIVVRGADRPLRAAATFPGPDGAPVTNLRSDGRELVFTDTDGVPRRVARADVERRTDGVPAPFVRRDLFLGRARFVFWSWAGGGFRPRTLP